jgi:broad specificity phosphatase PhoE
LLRGAASRCRTPAGDILSIVLVRHGPVALAGSHWATAAQMGEWVARYNAADLREASAPDAVVAMAAASAVLVASPLKRSQQSARQLFQHRTFLVDPLFAEAQLPIPEWPSLALPVFAWAAILRVAWLLGFSGTSEPREQAELRATRAADRLLELSRQYGLVMHVGHGVMLSFIGKCLAARGCRTPMRVATGHWSMRVYDVA